VTGMALDLDRIRAVVFDMDDTIIDWHGAEALAFRDTAEGHLVAQGVSLQEATSAYELVVQENYKAFRETGRWWFVQDRLRLLCERLGLEDHAEVLAVSFLEHSRRHLRWLPGGEEALQAARRGRRTALLTNGFSRVQRPKVEKFGLAERLDFIGVSEELGHWKPDRRAFEAVLGQVGVAPRDALMVGDSIVFDLEPARSLGMQTVWVSRTGGTDPSADLVVRDPQGLLPHLQAP